MELRNLPKGAIVGIVIALLVVLGFSSGMFINIQPGQKGVLFKTFQGGLDKEKVYGQGFQIIAPWNQMILYDVKEKETSERLEVLSNNGLLIKLDLSIIHHPIHEKIGYLHENIGEDYLDRIIKPAVRSVTREVIGNYTPEQLYASARDSIENLIYIGTKEIVNQKYIELPYVFIRDITLPMTLQTAIEQKLKQEQQAEEYDFKIDKAKKEAERKEIEARGIAEFQNIVKETITPPLLRWKGIEATLEISKSTNSKVIVIGNGDDDLPIILGGNN